MSETNRCRCGHPKSHHDGGECWTTVDGHEAFEETACSCSGFELADCRHSNTTDLAAIDGTKYCACVDCGARWVSRRGE